MGINEFRGSYAFLSNFYVYKFKHNGIEFRSSEHAYQWEKAETELDKSRILRALTPFRAKEIGHSIKINIKKWDSVKLIIMESILISKFSDVHLCIKLIDTKPYELIEGNRWHDNFWGICYCQNCIFRVQDNNLGKLLMKIRDME